MNAAVLIDMVRPTLARMSTQPTCNCTNWIVQFFRDFYENVYLPPIVIAIVIKQEVKVI